MATLYKRGRIWWARWYQVDGTRVSASTKTDKQREAARIGAELEAKDRRRTPETDAMATKFQALLRQAAEDANAGRLTVRRAEEILEEIRKSADPSYKRISIRECINEWIDDQIRRKVAGTTASGYMQMRSAVETALGKRINDPLGDFTHQEAGKLLHALKKGRTGATANLHFRAFRRALQSGVRAKQIHDNPADGVQPLPEDDSTEKAPFTPEEVSQLIRSQHTAHEWKGAILIGAHTGLRIGDIVKLTKAHIDGETIVIRPKKTQRKRKTLFIPMSPAVKAWFEAQEVGAFFPTLSKAKAGTLSTWFDRLRQKAGVPKFVHKAGIPQARTFHSLRHSFASWLADENIDKDVRKKLTGHSDDGIHAIYSHHDKALTKAIEKLPSI